MPVADASRIASGFRHALLLLVLTAGLLVLGVLFAGTARADERDTAGDAIGAVVRDAGEATGNDEVAAGRDEESAQRDDESTQRDGDESAQRDDGSTQRDDESAQRDGDESAQRDDESKSGEGATDPAVDSTETVRAVSHGTAAASEVSTARESAGLVSSDPGDTADHTADPPVTDIARNASDATGTAVDAARNTSDATGTAVDAARNASDALNAPGDLVARATDTTGGALGSPEVPGDLVARVTGTTGEAAGGIEPLGDLVMGTAGELLPGVMEPPGDLVAGVVGIADGGVLGALEAPVDLAVGTADEISAVLETPGDLVAAVVDTGAEAVGVLGAPVTITAGAFQDRGLAEVTVAVTAAVAGSGTGARLVDARPGTTSGEPGVGLSRGYLPEPAPAGEAVLARPPATGGSAAIGTPVHAAAPCGGPGLLAYSGGNLSSAAGGAPTDGTPLRPLASLPVTAPSPSSGGGSGLTSALLPVAAMVVPPALSRRLRHARGGQLASLCPSPGERPG